MMCENCKAYNAHVIMVGGKNGDRYVLCPRCLKILDELDSELEKIINNENMSQK